MIKLSNVHFFIEIFTLVDITFKKNVYLVDITLNEKCTLHSMSIRTIK